jgi:hypothetical protein
MSIAASSHRPSAKASSRRRSPRAPVVVEIQGREVALDIAVRVRDVGLGGFAVESPLPFATGSKHTFQFWSSDGRTTMTTAECRHCTAEPPRHGQAVYVAGFAFISKRAGQHHLILSMFAAIPA